MDAVVGFLIDNLARDLVHEANLLVGIENEVRLLRDELEHISDFLKSFADYKRKEDRLHQLIDLVYDAEDVIDKYRVSVFHERRENNIVWRAKHTLVHLVSRRSAAKEITSIRRKLEEIYIHGLGIAQAQTKTVAAEQNIPSLESPPSQTLSLYDDAVVGVFSAEKDMIINELVSGDAEEKLVGICGVGGIGKTTLARLIYNDLIVANHFDLRAWIHVSQVHSQRDLLETIMNCVVELGEEMKKMSDDKLRLELYRYMKSSRYLIVLDDVCEINKSWEDLNRCFPRNAFGSRIIVTTRIKELAFSLNPSNSNSPPYILQCLNTEKSWNLLSNQVFRGGQCPSGLKELGLQIAHKCAGRPLAISLIGGLLRKVKTVGWWRTVLLSLSDIIHDETGFLELSYNYLPHHLRQCLLYLGHFPQDYEISARQLTLLWVAEGFIPKKERATLEEVALLFLEELLDRNLIQCAQKKFDGAVKSCRIHDTLRLFCISKASKRNNLKVHPTASHLRYKTLHYVPRRLAINSKTLHYIFYNPTAPHLRSLLCFGQDFKRVSSKQWISLCTRFALLRVLELSGVVVDNIPSEIGKLICLRYLRLKSDSAETLPPSICNLWNLQTLDVTASLIERPLINIWKMLQLRHFYFNGEAVLPEPPEKSFMAPFLTNIQTLSFISPGSCKESVLTNMPNLIKLGIFGDLECHKDTVFHNLPNLKLVKKLELRRDFGYERLDRLPHGVQFPPTLQKLTLSQTELSIDPMKQLGQLHNLQVLVLTDSAYSGTVLDCFNCELHQLKVLKLVNLGITSWRVSTVSMPSLKFVVINRCGELEGLPSSLKHMSSLRELQLWWPNVLVAKCARDIEAYKNKERLKLMIYHAEDRDAMV